MADMSTPTSIAISSLENAAASMKVAVSDLENRLASIRSNIHATNLSLAEQVGQEAIVVAQLAAALGANEGVKAAVAVKAAPSSKAFWFYVGAAAVGVILIGVGAAHLLGAF